VEPGERTLSLYERICLEEPQVKIASAVPRRNPYAVRAMLKEPSAFVGRTAELRDLFTLLAAMQSFSVVGPRRIGKSSLLYYLTHPAVRAAHLPDPERYVVAFMDLQELAGAGQDEFFFTAVERFGRGTLVPEAKRSGIGELETPALHPQHGASAGELEIVPERDGTPHGFRRFLMRARDAGLRLVLCCDEFEMLSRNPYFSAEFFTYLRGLCSNYDLALVTASQASLFDLCQQNDLQTSEFWNIFVERALGLMPLEEAQALIREPFTRAGGTLSPTDVAFILQLAGPHPFFIQIACYHLFAIRSARAPGEVEREQTEIEGLFMAEARRYYAHAWARLEEAERETLRELARGEAISLPAVRFERLRREALVVGSSGSARLVSRGWRSFIGAI
jgi:hypothetical protein